MNLATHQKIEVQIYRPNIIEALEKMLLNSSEFCDEWSICEGERLIHIGEKVIERIKEGIKKKNNKVFRSEKDVDDLLEQIGN